MRRQNSRRRRLCVRRGMRDFRCRRRWNSAFVTHFPRWTVWAAVHVVVTLESTGKKIVEKDVPTRSTTEENKKGEETGSVTSSSQDEATVYEKTQNGAETPYVVSEEYPAVRGVLVIAEGGGNPVTIQEIQEAVMALFQVGANKIKVVKMK